MEHVIRLTQSAVPTEGDALYAGQVLRSRIVQRTQSGVDVEGAPFAEYSPGYRKQKIKKLDSASPVNLFGFEQHPHMMNAMVVLTEGLRLEGGESAAENAGANLEPAQYVEIGFYGEEAERAKIHNEGTGKMPQRRFFDATQEDLDLMSLAIEERQEARMARVR